MSCPKRFCNLEAVFLSASCSFFALTLYSFLSRSVSFHLSGSSSRSFSVCLLVSLTRTSLFLFFLLSFFPPFRSLFRSHSVLFPLSILCFPFLLFLPFLHILFSYFFSSFSFIFTSFRFRFFPILHFLPFLFLTLLLVFPVVFLTYEYFARSSQLAHCSSHV